MESLGAVTERRHRVMQSALRLPTEEPGPSPQYIFSLAAYNKYFYNVVYILLGTPSCITDGWTGVRCTGRANGISGDCEHAYRLRRLPIPGRVEAAIDVDNVVTSSSGGRRRGSFTTIRGKRAAERNLLDEADMQR